MGGADWQSLDLVLGMLAQHGEKPFKHFRDNVRTFGGIWPSTGTSWTNGPGGRKLGFMIMAVGVLFVVRSRGILLHAPQPHKLDGELSVSAEVEGDRAKLVPRQRTAIKASDSIPPAGADLVACVRADTHEPRLVPATLLGGRRPDSFGRRLKCGTERRDHTPAG